MMNLLISLIAILILALLALGLAMSHSMIFILAVVLPYAAFAIFLCGFIYRLISGPNHPFPSAFLQRAVRRNRCPGSRQILWKTRRGPGA